MGNISRIEVKKHEANSQNFDSNNRKPCCSKTRSTPADRVLFLQRTIGNQAVQRLMKSGVLQAKLKIGAPGDVYEQEADRVAEWVMRMPEPQAVSSGTPYIQRACLKCEKEELKRQPVKEEDEEEKMQRKPVEEEEDELQAKVPSGNISEVSPDLESHIQSLKVGGQPLPESVSAFFEPRFGHDLSHVQIHTDAKASGSARALSAEAFTLGKSIYFAKDRFSPGTNTGRKLLAHELVHTFQQARENGKISRMTASGRQVSLTMPMIQRKVKVNDPAITPAGAPPAETNEKIVKDYVSVLCPGFTVTAGDVVPTAPVFCPAGASASSTKESCECLCEMHTLINSITGAAIVWWIDVDDNDWPHTDPGTNTVTVHSPYSGVRFGSWAAGPPAHRMQQQNWLVLGHELCGHARLFAKGTHPVGPPPTHGGRPSHDVTVQIENKIASEHGIPASELRGLFADPHHGESFARVTISQFPTGSANVSALPAAEKRKIDIAEAFIKSAPVKMDVIGHVDKPASSAAINLTMSQQRADNVKAELVSRGILAGRFMASNGVGDVECSLPGNQPSCRKVEVFMFIMEGASVTHP
jgi:outer membrane protein OmpA-like peptidoglycan-associated protein